MNKFLNNVFKGLIISLVIIVAGGYLSLKINPTSTKTTTNKMVLISTSLVSSLLTEKEDNLNLDTLEKPENEQVKEEVEVKTETKEETKVEVKEEIKEVVKEEPKQEIIEEVKEEPKQEETKPNDVTIKGEYKPNLAVLETIEVLETYVGKMTAYGPDCYGCTSGRTASGQYVMDGNIYYNDPTFGNIRIVAADKTIPFGSIIRISGLNIFPEPILAIVLDRGGMIGFAEGKHSYFDLLYKSEKDAASFGRPTATFELLRRGY
ncbi:MAG: 3D domain-containing protein [Erysipelotrichaceae bacterium]|nr:3D domain-containing protein [Erysipelotrichaceae bacterium]